MKALGIISLSLLVLGCRTDRELAQVEFAPLARHVTAELVDRHLMNDVSPAPAPIHVVEDGHPGVEFEGRCVVLFARGKEWLSDQDMAELRSGLFAQILGDGLFPKIGARCHIGGLEQDVVVFTTTDERYDVRIEPRGHPQPVDVVRMAEELSGLYDRAGVYQATGSNGAQPLSRTVH